MSSLYTMTESPPTSVYDEIKLSGISSRVFRVATSYATTERRLAARRRSSHARNGSLLDCTKTGPFVYRSNCSCTAFFQASRCRENTIDAPSFVQRTSLFSATYEPAATGTVVTRPVARSQITGSNASLCSTSIARRAPSGDHARLFAFRLSGNSARDLPVAVSMTHT